MSPNHTGEIPWTRYWYPRESAARLSEDGFLIPPDEHTMLGVDSDLQVLRDAEDEDCLILLGPAGMGKTHAIKQAIDRLQEDANSHSPRTEYVDLRTRSESQVENLLETGESVEAWREGEVVYLFLDNADMYRGGLPTLGPLLSEKLSGPEEGDLYLRIACRSGEWPPSVGGHLEDAFETVRTRNLAPLSRQDVRLAAQQLDLDADAFLSAVQTNGVGPLAARPITLLMLLDMFEETDDIPESASVVYEQGCRHLCARIGSHAEEDPMETSTEHRLATARRLAAMTLLCQRTGIDTSPPPEGDCDQALCLPDAIGGSEPVEGNPTPITSDVIRETLKTGLFVTPEADFAEWEHISYAEYLAASYLMENDFDTRQIDELLFRGPPGERRVAPPLRSLAAWLAEIDQDILETLLETDPEVLLEVDLSRLSDAVRRNLVDRLHSMVEQGILDHHSLKARGGLDKLRHDNLESQLQNVITDSELNIQTREMAIRIGAACSIQAIEPTLLNIIFDEEEPLQLRVAAAHAIAHDGSTETREELAPLLDWDDERDPDDEFKGCALRALWPDHLGVEELFENLDPPRDPNRFGAYSWFLSSLPTKLSVSDIPPALDWVIGQEFERGDTGSLVRLGDRIVVLAVHNAGDSDVHEKLVELAAHRLNEHEPLLYRDRGEGMEVWEGNQEPRRELVREILRELDDPTRSHILLRVNPPLVAPSDFEWLIEVCAQEEDQTLAKSYARLLLSLQEREPDQVAALYELSREHDTAGEVLGPLFEAVELESDRAEEMRDQHELFHQLADQEEPESRLDRPIEEILSELLEEFDNGNLDAWWRLCLSLQYDTRGIRSPSAPFNPDIREYPGWESLSEDQQDVLPELCLEYLREYEHELDQPYREVQHSRPYLSAYRALHHLSVEAPALLDELEDEDWQRWTPIILDLPFGTMGDESGCQPGLIHRALEAAPDAVIHGVQRLLPEEGDGDDLTWDPRVLQGLLDGDLADAVFEALKVADLSGRRIRLLLSMLLSEGHEPTAEYVEELVSHPPDDGQQERWIAAALALIEAQGRNGWITVWPVIEAEEGLADRFFRAFLGGSLFGREESTLDMNADEWGDVYIWLCQRYPPEEDPEFEEGFGVDFRWLLMQWRNRLPQRIADLGTPEAVETLELLVEEFPEQSHLPRLVRNAQEKTIERSWTPLTPGELKQLAEDERKRFVDSPDELLGIVIETLDRLNVRLQDQETRAARDLWDRQDNDVYRPVPEPALSDWIKRSLELELEEGGVIVNRETEVERDGDTDIKIEIGATDVSPRMVVTIEVKGSWNQDLEDAMEDQLLGQYMEGHGCDHGVYLVGWFNEEPWDDDHWAKDSAHQYTREDLDEMLTGQASQLSIEGVHIESFILDCSLHP